MWLPIMGGRVGEVDGEMDGVAEGSAGMGSAAARWKLREIHAWRADGRGCGGR
jgi:hypothetical protein